jgi:hypothetical protein
MFPTNSHFGVENLVGSSKYAYFRTLGLMASGTLGFLGPWAHYILGPLAHGHMGTRPGFFGKQIELFGRFSFSNFSKNGSEKFEKFEQKLLNL